MSKNAWWCLWQFMMLEVTWWCLFYEAFKVAFQRNILTDNADSSDDFETEKLLVASKTQSIES